MAMSAHQATEEQQYTPELKKVKAEFMPRTSIVSELANTGRKCPL